MTTDRRTAIADAAIATLAAQGMRGLTHRAVDRAAGLSEGSTSYYLRTREALIFAAVARMAELDEADIGDLPTLGATDGPDALAPVLTALIRRWLTEGRDRTIARYELTLEGTRRPELRAELARHGAAFRSMTEAMLTAAGVAAPRRRAHTLLSFVDGLIYHQLAGTGTDEFDDKALLAACREMLATAWKSE